MACIFGMNRVAQKTNLTFQKNCGALRMRLSQNLHLPGSYKPIIALHTIIIDFQRASFMKILRRMRSGPFYCDDVNANIQ